MRDMKMNERLAAKAAGAGEVKELLVEGRRFSYFEAGSGKTIVLVHGLFGDYLDWAPVLAPLSARFRVIALDLPGFGGSNRPPGGQTLDAYAESLEAFFAALDLHDFLLVGNSLGGMISSNYAARHAERLRGLVLVSSAGMKAYSDEDQARVAERFSAAMLNLLRPEHIEPLFTINFARLSAQREAYMQHQRTKLSWPHRKEYSQVLSDCAQMGFAHQVTPWLEKLTLPILLLWGDADPVFPLELAEAALPHLRDARLEVLHQAIHMPQMDQPELFVEAVERFLKSIQTFG